MAFSISPKSCFCRHTHIQVTLSAWSRLRALACLWTGLQLDLSVGFLKLRGVQHPCLCWAMLAGGGLGQRRWPRRWGAGVWTMAGGRGV